MTADPFTMACPRYRYARRLGSEPLPLAAGEVMELRPSARFTAANAIALGVLAAAAITFFAMIGAFQ